MEIPSVPPIVNQLKGKALRVALEEHQRAVDFFTQLEPDVAALNKANHEVRTNPTATNLADWIYAAVKVAKKLEKVEHLVPAYKKTTVLKLLDSNQNNRLWFSAIRDVSKARIERLVELGVKMDAPPDQNKDPYHEAWEWILYWIRASANGV